MRFKFVLMVPVILVGGAIAHADTLNTGGGFFTSTGTFTAFNGATLLATQGSCPGGVCTAGSVFFNNTSSDNVVGSLNSGGSTAANAGDFLGATGAFSPSNGTIAGCSTCGVNYMASGGQMYLQANSPDFASAFSFIRQAASVQITLLYSNSSTNNNLEFGLYDASSVTSALQNHAIVQQGGVTNLNNIIGTVYNVTNPYATYGIYARTCDINAATGACPGANIVTDFSNVAMNSLNGDDPAADSAHMHWALFQSGTNAAIYYLALEDFSFQSGNFNSVEGFGDYNDLIIELNTDAAPIPEPATLSIVGLSLASLGVLRRRKLKS